MKRIGITGGYGFLGWHTACRMRALGLGEPVRLGREDFAGADVLARRLRDIDGVLHLAGVNRAATDDEVEQGNLRLAQLLAMAIRSNDHPIDVVYANSIHASQDSAYGRGKAAAAGVLGAATTEVGGAFADLLLPNLFGEHGRPGYNSFVATFAHSLLDGGSPQVTDDREIALLHAQNAAQILIEHLGASTRVEVAGDPITISEVLGQFRSAHDLYRNRGEVPPLRSRLEVNLFNTYRAAAFPTMWPISPVLHSDARGDLFETVRAHGGTGQTFVSTTRPGQVRGDHFHLHKVERFVVVRGEAEIRLRRLLHDDVVSFRLGGDKPSFVDMPTLWVHNIRNVGSSELVTMFWADQLLDPDAPDQYPEKVDPA